MQNLSIIVVDDDDDLRESLVELLQEEGHQVDSVNSAKLSLKKITSKHYDLLISDVLMPEMDGIELLQELVSIGFQGKTLIMSGGGRISSEDYLVIAENLDADGTIKKPFSSEDLFSTIERIIC
jgi:DNA-binding NtrC family response regulator